MMSTEKEQLKCLNCGELLKGICRKFCSSKCKSSYRNKKQVDRVCENCGKHFIGPYRSIACSKECRDSLRTKKYKENFTNKYGVDNPSKLESSREKFKKTMIERYGVEHPSYSKELINRQHEKFFELYGVDNPMKIKEIANKSVQGTIQTNMEKYGVPYYVMTQHCREANNVISKPNLEFISLLDDKGIKSETEFPIECFSYDIKVGNTLIEINPFPYHNSTRSPNGNPKKNSYHYDKLKLAIEKGYRCIMVRDWDDIEKVSYLLDDNKETLYARNCELKQINYEDCHNFFEQYHLQGDTKKDKNNIYVGLYYNDELVECMSFGIPRYNKKYEWEILRLCSHKKYKIVGGANRIFKKFLEITKANSVISYCDMSKFDGKVYESLGFDLLKRNKPSKHWYNIGEEDSKKHITDNMLRQYGYDKLFNENFGKGTSNDELMKQRGYVEIFDCGQSTFVWQTELSYEIG